MVERTVHCEGEPKALIDHAALKKIGHGVVSGCQRRAPIGVQQRDVLDVGIVVAEHQTEYAPTDPVFDESAGTRDVGQKCSPTMWDPRSRVEYRSPSDQRSRSRRSHRFQFSSRSSANQEISPSFNEHPPTPNRCWGMLVGRQGLTVSEREPLVHQAWALELSPSLMLRGVPTARMKYSAPAGLIKNLAKPIAR